MGDHQEKLCVLINVFQATKLYIFSFPNSNNFGGKTALYTV
jgi:hypothetical protein